MIWLLYGFLHSILRAALTESGRVYQGDKAKLAFWQALFGLVFLLFLTPLMTWPAEERFYMAALGVSLIMTVGTQILLGMTSRRVGRVSSIYMPLETLAAFVLWLFVMPGQLDDYTGNPALAACIAGAFAIAAFALARIRPQDWGWYVFTLVLPIGLTYAVAGVVTKIVLPPVDALPLALAYATINFAVMTLVTGVSLLLKGKNEGIREPALLRAGALAGLFSMGSYVAFIMGVAFAPNPGYISLLAILLPVWLLLWHRATKTENTASLKAAVAIVAGIVLFVGGIVFLG